MSDALVEDRRRTRVLVWHWGRRGGGPRYTLDLARALASDPSLDVHLSVSRQSELFAQFQSMDLPRLDVDTYTGAASAAFGLHRVITARRRFGRYLRDQHIDVVVCTMTHLWNLAMLGTIARSSARYLLTLHDGRLHDGDNDPVRRWMIARETSRADGIVTLSRHVRREVSTTAGVPGERIATVPLGVSEAKGLDTRVRRLPRDRAVRVLFFGRIRPYKGLDLLVGAFAALQRIRPVELVIAGSGPLGAAARAIAATPGIRLRNEWIPEADIDGLFRDADVVVLPYREASQSGVAVHAFEHRVPMVVTPVGGLVEQVTHLGTGVVASQVSAAGVAEALEHLLGDPGLYERCSREMGAVIEARAGWSKVGAAMADAIRRVPRRD